MDLLLQGAACREGQAAALDAASLDRRKSAVAVLASETGIFPITHVALGRQSR